MTDADEPDEASEPGVAGPGRAGPRLVAVRGPGSPSEAPPPVRLRREFKGLTVADLLRDEIVDQLPGQARSALRHIERGDHAAAERALPGEFAPVLPGPWQRRRERRLLVAVLVVVAGLVAAAVATWLPS